METGVLEWTQCAKESSGYPCINKTIGRTFRLKDCRDSVSNSASPNSLFECFVSSSAQRNRWRRRNIADKLPRTQEEVLSGKPLRVTQSSVKHMHPLCRRVQQHNANLSPNKALPTRIRFQSARGDCERTLAETVSQMR